MAKGSSRNRRGVRIKAERDKQRVSEKLTWA